MKERNAKDGITVTNATATPLVSGNHIYWDPFWKNIVLRLLSKSHPNVTVEYGKDAKGVEDGSIKATFRKDSHAGREMCATSRSLEASSTLVPESEVDALVADLDSLHREAEKEENTAEARRFAREYRVPDPREMRGSWRIARGPVKRLLLLWGYHDKGNAQGAVLPQTATSRKWDDAAQRVDLKSALRDAQLIGKSRLDWGWILSRTLGGLLLLLLLLLLFRSCKGCDGCGPKPTHCPKGCEMVCNEDGKCADGCDCGCRTNKVPIVCNCGKQCSDSGKCATECDCGCVTNGPTGQIKFDMCPVHTNIVKIGGECVAKCSVKKDDGTLCGNHLDKDWICDKHREKGSQEDEFEDCSGTCGMKHRKGEKCPARCGCGCNKPGGGSDDIKPGDKVDEDKPGDKVDEDKPGDKVDDIKPGDKVDEKKDVPEVVKSDFLIDVQNLEQHDDGSFTPDFILTTGNGRIPADAEIHWRLDGENLDGEAGVKFSPFFPDGSKHFIEAEISYTDSNGKRQKSTPSKAWNPGVSDPERVRRYISHVDTGEDERGTFYVFKLQSDPEDNKARVTAWDVYKVEPEKSKGSVKSREDEYGRLIVHSVDTAANAVLNISAACDIDGKSGKAVTNQWAINGITGFTEDTLTLDQKNDLTVVGNGLKKSVYLVDTGKGSGTAFAVTKRHLVTNRHVAKGAGMGGQVNLFQSKSDTLIGAHVVAVAPEGSPDLALLEVDSNAPDMAALAMADTVKMKQPVVCVGFSDEALKSERAKTGGLDPSVSSGIIEGYDLQSETVFSDLKAFHGNSGSPVANEDGQLIGVLFAGLAIDAPEGEIEESTHKSLIVSLRMLRHFLDACVVY